MDTQFHCHSDLCVACGKCVRACPQHIIHLDGALAYGLTYANVWVDYVPCHHCDGFWDKDTPCIRACPNHAIFHTRR